MKEKISFWSLFLVFAVLLFILFDYPQTHASPSEKNLRDTHQDFDKAFVTWTNRVNEKAEHVSLSSPDFWDEPREWWYEMQVGEKFRRFEEELTDDDE